MITIASPKNWKRNKQHEKSESNTSKSWVNKKTGSRVWVTKVRSTRDGRDYHRIAYQTNEDPEDMFSGLDKFKSKRKAHKFATDWMRDHPLG